jgi:N-methylhydantoinase B
MRLDPVTLEILATKVSAITEEMGIALQRSGRTIYVKETEDFGTGLMNLAGKTFAYPNGGIGVVNMVDNDASRTIASVADLEPGDVIITNDPYRSDGLASHLPDIHLLQPYFHGGEVVCFGWCFIHCADVGGRVPSSISPSNHDIHQEGLMIPPLKLVKRGEFNGDVVAFIRANCRTAEENLGDLRAMVASLGVGARRVAAIIAQHGVETVAAATTDIVAYSAAKARDAFRTIPDGTYEFTDYLDDDYNSPLPVRIHAKLTARDGLLTLDFTGTDPQVASAYNLPSAGGRHTWLTIRLMHYALTRDPSIPINSGLFEPITLVTPRGSLLNPVFPAAVGVRHATGNRVCDVVSGLLCQAAPDFMRAAGCGLLVPIVLAEPADEEGRRKVDVVEPLSGGTGAALGMDGIDARETSVSGMSNNPIEAVEAAAAVTILRYGIRPDSGGPGRWRGGAGLELTFAPTIDGCQVLGRGVERFRFAPWGLLGGRCARRARIVRNMGRPDEEDLGKIDLVDMRLGDTITILTPGGGGYGDPFEREPRLVLADVERGIVSEDRALEDYGVVIRGGTVDAEATALARSGRRPASPTPAQFDFGEERDAWDDIVVRATERAVASTYDGLSPAARSSARYQVFAPVIAALRRGQPLDREALERAVGQMLEGLQGDRTSPDRSAR